MVQNLVIFYEAQEKVSFILNLNLSDFAQDDKEVDIYVKNSINVGDKNIQKYYTYFSTGR